ncbi:MAG: ATP-binding protein [Deltaproteobacteria bacterium]|nr:ATP-binding protein [Deltaproteobacteria bacterium]
MKIAIASGKGGTGKTTIAVNLAQIIASLGHPVTLLDCDVEEPNCHLFLRPEITGTYPVAIPLPKVLENLCNGCGLCAQVCEYHALMVMGKQVLVFPELCHGCGACSLLCPGKAIVEEGHPIGSVEEGFSQGIRFVQGRLNIGEVMTPAVIRQVRRQGETTGVCLIDSPPGTSCPVVESVRDTDFVLLVTEPTPFGLHDLTLAVEMVRALARPFAVALNRCDAGDERVRSYCEREGIEILLSIPDDRRIAEGYARGDIDLWKLPEYWEMFYSCYRRITALVNERQDKMDQAKRGTTA